MFGTDFPIIDFERATREVGEIGFKETCKEKLLWKNAARLYKLSAKDGF
jgi:predicted TIM-barrel fold metal-dependent hydrolase